MLFCCHGKGKYAQFTLWRTEIKKDLLRYNSPGFIYNKEKKHSFTLKASVFQSVSWGGSSPAWFGGFPASHDLNEWLDSLIKLKQKPDKGPFIGMTCEHGVSRTWTETRCCQRFSWFSTSFTRHSTLQAGLRNTARMINLRLLNGFILFYFKETGTNLQKIMNRYK